MTHPATLIRAALKKQGIETKGKVFFTHARKDGTKRIKLWEGTCVYQTSVAKRAAIIADLRVAFGDKFVTAYLMQGPGKSWQAWSFCVVFKV